MLLILLSGTGIAQNIATDTSVPVVAYWKKGEKKTFVITKTVEKSENGKVINKSAGTYGATLLVKDSAAEGYTMEWVYQYKSDKVTAPDAQIKGYEELLNNLKVVYATDDVGSFKKLLNYDEIKIFIDKSIRLLLASSADKEMNEQVTKQVKELFGSQQSVEQILLRDISLYHSLYGAEYNLKKLEAETMLPNFLGGDPWPAILSVRLVKKPAGNNALVYMDMNVDKVKAAENIKQFALKLGASMGKTIPESEIPNLLEISDHYEFEILLNSGWMKRAYMKRIGRTGGLSKLETLTVLLK